MRSYVVVLFSIIYFSCSDNKAENTVPAAPPPPKYFYYPKANVYFDTVNKDYLFLGGDGKWVTEKQIPAVVQAMMDKHVLLDTFSQPVWKDNENHRLVYSAALYASPKDTVDEVPEPVVLKPATPEPEVKKEKKGLRRFLDKLFSRKKKEEEKKE